VTDEGCRFPGKDERRFFTRVNHHHLIHQHRRVVINRARRIQILFTCRVERHRCVKSYLLKDPRIYAYVYHESIKRELKIRCIYECRCDERLQSKTKEFTCSETLGWSWN
jgi:hypothetical protein